MAVHLGVTSTKTNTLLQVAECIHGGKNIHHATINYTNNSRVALQQHILTILQRAAPSFSQVKMEIENKL